MKKLVDQCSLRIDSAAQAVGEKIDHALVNGTGYPVIDGGPRNHALGAVSVLDRGPVGKLADVLLNFIGCRSLRQTFDRKKLD